LHQISFDSLVFQSDVDKRKERGSLEGQMEGERKKEGGREAERKREGEKQREEEGGRVAEREKGREGGRAGEKERGRKRERERGTIFLEFIKNSSQETFQNQFYYKIRQGCKSSFKNKFRFVYFLRQKLWFALCYMKFRGLEDCKSMRR
jgi:hypothetical protein